MIRCLRGACLILVLQLNFDRFDFLENKVIFEIEGNTRYQARKLFQPVYKDLENIEVE